ncbi:MAG: acyloxyacyl hydrolase, partial [Cyanobacteria bacterium J06554_11]
TSFGVEETTSYEIDPAHTLITQSSAEEGPPAFGTAGTQRWYVHGSVAGDLDDDFWGMVGGGATHFFANGHSINLELNGFAFDQPGDDALGLNLNLLLRSHWLRRENWSLYVDGGAGIIGTTNDVPADGSSFNFTPQVGGGATFNIQNEKRLMVGLRWHHISNADTFESNPGLDALQGYVGVNLPF